MKKIVPKLGDVRIIKKFTFCPIYIKHEDEVYRISLEKYISHQKYCATYIYESALTGAMLDGYAWIEFDRKLIT